MTPPWDPDDPRLRRKLIPGETWHDRIYRRMAEGPKRRDWADRILRPEPDEEPVPASQDDENEYRSSSSTSDEGRSYLRGHGGTAGHAGNCGHESSRGNRGHSGRSYNDRGDGFAPTTFEEIEAAERARRANRDAEAAEQHEVQEVAVGKRGHVLAGLNPRSRKPGGCHRLAQRSPGRNPPAPTIPVSPAIIELVLRRGWRTPGGWVNIYRRRALAAISVALALPPDSSTMTRLCELRYHDLVMLDLRMPAAGWRHVHAWLRIREGMLGAAVAFNTSWLAIPPGTNGRPRMIGWAMTQTLHRAGAPAWRSRDLVRASWSGFVTTMSWSEASRLRRA